MVIANSQFENNFKLLFQSCSNLEVDMVIGIQITKAANAALLNSFWLLDNEK